jgi:anti-anti-sigma regulatory factor
VLDLRELQFMDSTGPADRACSGPRALVSVAPKLVVVRAPDEVDRVFRLTRMDHHLELVDEPPPA